MRSGVMCSWCHAWVYRDARQWPMCQDCWHRADVARMDCDCIACVRTHGQPWERKPMRER